jgi:carbon monoxide dehydrogenase subunit G
VATRSASADLLATPADVWAFIAEPRQLADWWPNVATVEPDRLGLAAGARWRVRSREATWFRRANTEDTLLVHVAEPGQRFVFELVRARITADLRLAEVGPGRTRADLAASGSLLGGFTRSLPRDALARLRALVQTTDAL